MRVARYMRAERAIAKGSKNDIRARWEWGHVLINDPEKVYPGSGNLRPGVAEGMVAAARKRGLILSEREVRYRAQAARAYSHVSQVGSAAADFESWRALCDAGFPPYPAPDDEPAFDPRTDEERAADEARRAAEKARERMDGAHQLSLFPHEEPEDSTKADLKRYAGQMKAMTARFLERDHQRDEYLAALDATGLPDDATWLECHRAAFPADFEGPEAEKDGEE